MPKKTIKTIYEGVDFTVEKCDTLIRKNDCVEFFNTDKLEKTIQKKRSTYFFFSFFLKINKIKWEVLVFKNK